MSETITRAAIEALDAADPLARRRERFALCLRLQRGCGVRGLGTGP
jgi:hypothetical protein